MKTKFLPLVLLCFCAFAKAQVGIGTTSPQATLDIPASNPAAPTAEDGILIPRIDEFPATNPTAAQDGMMVFVSGNGSPTKGFYYWNNTTSTWILLNNGGGGTDDQQIDVLNLNGTNLEISLEDDGVATQTLDLSSLGGAQRINDLLDGKSDNDGTDNGSSIFLGENAGSTDNATNNRNIGIGFESLNANSNGQNNIAIGYQSLTNNLASNNIAIGNLTLNSLLGQGLRNIAIGQNAQIATTTGDDNIAIGDNAMTSNTLARFNVAIGTRALNTTTTNGQNTAIGYESLTSNTGGTNTALGYRSLPANTTGVANVVLGHEAGLLNTGDANIFIGKSAGALETTASNRLYIENSNANADNALLYGEFDNDVLRTNGELQIGNPATTGYSFPVADGTTGQVMTTDGAGNVSFQDMAATTDTDDQQIDVLNLNGTTLEISLQDDGVATETLDLSSLIGGDITGVTAGAGLTGGGTTGTPTLNAAANNGLNIDAAADRIQLGGPLTENTTITQGAFRFTHNLTSTGDFMVQDNGMTRFAVFDNGRVAVGSNATAGNFNVTGNSFFTDDINLLDGSVAGVNIVRIHDSSDDGVIDVYRGGVLRNRIHGNGDSFINGGNLGIGTASPMQKLHVIGTGRFNALIGAGNRMVIATPQGDLATASIPNADITGVIAGSGLIGGSTSGTATLNAAANNGLNVDFVEDRIQLGGPLSEPTTINLGAFSLTHNLNSTGDFLVQDNGVNRFAVLDNGQVAVGSTATAGNFNVTGSSVFSDDLSLRDGTVTGVNLIRLYDASDDGVIDVFQGGAIRNRIHGNGNSYFNGGDVGFGTNIPSATVDIIGSLQYTDGNQSNGHILMSDATGNASWSDPSLIGGAERINDLIDGKSDNDGTQDGSSIFLGIDAGNNDDGSDNKNIGIGFSTLRFTQQSSNNM